MDLSFLNDLKIKVTPNAQLKDYTTFRLGGPCRAMIECATATELTTTVMRLRAHNIPFFIMGFGSNTLVADKGVDAVIVRFCSDSPVIKREGERLMVEGSALFDKVICFSIKEGLDGLTTFSGIPGTIAGAIAGNAGAYGIDISHPLSTITLLKPDNHVITVTKEQVQFNYRDSALKHNGDIILSATFILQPGKDPDALMKIHDSLIATRTHKHGDWRQTPSAGSFFRNVEPTSKAGPRQSAGWFLDQSGAKELNIRGARCHSEHANILTRDEGASAQAVLDYAMEMKRRVKEKFGIDLTPEVRLLGKFDNLE